MARALYIHWPFCLSKCPYCDFNSHVRDDIDVELWTAALLADLRHEAARGPQEPLESVFFGGGTPSLMPPALVSSLLNEAEKLRGFAPGVEVTLEANPTSVEAARFAGFRAAGVNRVSLGLQSLEDESLRFLGRRHSAAEGLRALDLAQAHFPRVSFDLIYARPGQTAGQWDSELARALAFGTEHLSLYQLTIEPSTRFATDARQGAFTPLADDPAADLYALTQCRTSAAGLASYEVSNHAQSGAQSVHNLAYWHYEDYHGVGPGAHGRRDGLATVRHRKPENWLQSVADHGHGIAEERRLSPREQAGEALLMGLRLSEGIEPSALARRFGLAEADLLDWRRLALHSGLGLVWQRAGRTGVTGAGMPVLDALLGELVPDALAAG